MAAPSSLTLTFENLETIEVNLPSLLSKFQDVPSTRITSNPFLTTITHQLPTPASAPLLTSSPPFLAQTLTGTFYGSLVTTVGLPSELVLSIVPHSTSLPTDTANLTDSSSPYNSSSSSSATPFPTHGSAASSIALIAGASTLALIIIAVIFIHIFRRRSSVPVVPRSRSRRRLSKLFGGIDSDIPTDVEKAVRPTPAPDFVSTAPQLAPLTIPQQPLNVPTVTRNYSPLIVTTRSSVHFSMRFDGSRPPRRYLSDQPSPAGSNLAVLSTAEVEKLSDRGAGKGSRQSQSSGTVSSEGTTLTQMYRTVERWKMTTDPSRSVWSD